ncbi:MAG: porin [Hydrogenophaga sp.]
MKKTLIALAAVAATGAAFAQSSVTLDGVVELGVVNPAGANTPTRLDAANGASQIRFRGTEDLGGGLKANFVLAQRLSLESGGNDGGANGRPTFQGESTVGLSGGFGSIKLGRALTALQGPINATDPWGTLQQANTAILPNGYYTEPTGNVDGSGLGRTDGIFYNSPNFSGFSFAATVGPKFSGTNALSLAAQAANTKSFLSVYGSYAAGPLVVGIGYEQNRRDDTVTFAHAIYDFGFVRVGGGFATVEASANAPAPGALPAGQEANNWNIMAIAPLGPVNLKFGYGESENDTTGVARSKKLGLGLDYPLSKRTLIYTSLGRDSVLTTNKVGYDIGIRHTF